MTPSPQPAATRNSERTRRTVLDAASVLLVQHGTAVTINEIATAAGVSKSGLLHHFPTREGLFLAVLVDSLERLRREILGFVDLAENRPGKVLRAYVRALCGGSPTAMDAYGHSGVWGTLARVPGAAEVLDDDCHTWAELFAQDGLDPDRILVVRNAVEGLVTSLNHDVTVTAETVEHARTLFFDLIDTDRWP